MSMEGEKKGPAKRRWLAAEKEKTGYVCEKTYLQRRQLGGERDRSTLLQKMDGAVNEGA